MISDALPEENTLAKSFYDTKKIILGLGLSYEKVHVCSNEFVLYQKDLVDVEICTKCNLLRLKFNSDDVECKKKK